MTDSKIDSFTQTDSSVSDFVTVSNAEEDASGKELYELPLDKDGNLCKNTLQSSFPQATSVKYKNPETGAIRILKEENNVIHPPPEGWGKTQYTTHSAKREASPSPSVAPKIPRTSLLQAPQNRQQLISNTIPPLLPPNGSSMNFSSPYNNSGHFSQNDFNAQFASDFNGGIPPLYCEVCNITFDDTTQATFHFEGKRHNDMLIKQLQPMNQFINMPIQHVSPNVGFNSSRGRVQRNFRSSRQQRGGRSDKNGRSGFAQGVKANKSLGNGQQRGSSTKRNHDASSRRRGSQRFDGDEFDGIQF